jgi:hypothetical protein
MRYTNILAGCLLAAVLMPTHAAELGVLAPVMVGDKPQFRTCGQGRPAPVVTRVVDGELYAQLQREARDGFVATVLALDENAQRAAGAREVRPTWLYMSAEDGGFARQGFWLQENGKQRFVDEPYVDLVVDEGSVGNGDFEEIFAHEMGHVYLRRLLPDLPPGYSHTPHASMSITDYSTAFDEGFATHFQGLARRLTSNPKLREQELGLSFKPFLGYWMSNLDRAGRIEGVRRNWFVQSQLLPPGDEATALARRDLSTAFDNARLREGQQMLSSEGVIATIFYRWMVPGAEDREAVVQRYSRLFASFAHRDGRRLRHDSPVLLDLVDRYCSDAADDCKRVQAVVLDTTYGATAGRELPALTESLAATGRLGDMESYVGGLKQARTQMAQLQEQVAKEPAKLRAGLGPDLWLLAAGQHLGWRAESDVVAVNLNTAELESLMLLPGIDRAAAERALASRRKDGVFADLEDFVRRAGADAGTAQKLRQAAEAARKAGPYDRI